MRIEIEDEFARLEDEEGAASRYARQGAVISQDRWKTLSEWRIKLENEKLVFEHLKAEMQKHYILVNSDKNLAFYYNIYKTQVLAHFETKENYSGCILLKKFMDHFHFSFEMNKKYKYLNYAPTPVKLDSSCYDLVDDEEFIESDDRIPLLMVTQFGIYPSGDKKGNDNCYLDLIALYNRTIGFIGRGHYSSRERDGVIEILLDSNTINRIRNKDLQIDLGLWEG